MLEYAEPQPPGAQPALSAGLQTRCNQRSLSHTPVSLASDREGGRVMPSTMHPASLQCSPQGSPRLFRTPATGSDNGRRRPCPTGTRSGRALAVQRWQGG